MLIVRLYGGLGNQMFQYAFYQFLKLNNDNVYVDLSDFQVHNHHNGFELDRIFNVEYKESTCIENKKISVSQNSLIYRTFKKLTKLSIEKCTEINESRFHGFTVSQATYNKDMYFNGYWQNKVYASETWDVLKNHFTFKNKPDERNAKLMQQYADKNTVSVHIRCGDYFGNSSLGGICDSHYYEKAFSEINKLVSDPVFLIFSDDIEWVKKHIETPENSVFVNWNTGNNSYQDMQMMSLCKHNIIANSTFSWWGAKLNDNPKKIVISPRRWFNDQDFNPLLCDGWITV